jgi:hypothetical protein
MAKANVNTASRDELVEAGVRAELADEILKLRRKGKVDLEALDELPGVGPVTVEQLRKLLDFSDRTGNGGGAEQATLEATKAAIGAPGGPVEASASVARSGLQVAQRAIGAVGGAQREMTLQSAESTAELGQALVHLVGEQSRHNFETWTALAGAVDWDQVAKAQVVKAVDWNRVFQIQGEYLHTSLERAAQLSRRYLEGIQAVMTAAADTARDRAKAA